MCFKVMSASIRCLCYQLLSQRYLPLFLHQPFSNVRTSNPSIAACNAHIGSISVTITLAPAPCNEAADPFPTSPYPANYGYLSGHHCICCSSELHLPQDSLHPYLLSNLDLVTESFTLIAGIEARFRCSSLSYQSVNTCSCLLRQGL